MLRTNLGLLIIGLILTIGAGIVIGLQLVVVGSQQTTTDLANDLAERIADDLKTPATTLPTSGVISAVKTRAADEPIQAVDKPEIAVVHTNLSSLQKLLQTANLTITSDDSLIRQGVANDPYAIGFIRSAASVGDTALVRAVPLVLADGSLVDATPDAVLNGRYPLSSVLYIYATESTIRQKPQVAAFIACYLNRINTVIWETGYFPTHQQAIQEAERSFNSAVGNLPNATMPACQVDGWANNPINIAGSAEVATITQQMTALFKQDGFQGDIKLNSLGTAAGFEAFCTEAGQDIVNADRPIETSELLRCLEAGRAPLGFAIGEAVVSIVVSQQNDFVNNLSLAQIRKIFAEAETWAGVDPNWPAVQISRVVPSQTKHAFNTFMDKVFNADSSAFMVAQLSSPVAANGQSQPTTVGEASIIASPTVADADQLATPTAIPPTVAPPTPIPPTPIPPTPIPPTPIPSTSTSEPPTPTIVTATATPLPPTPRPTVTSTPLPLADYTIGYLPTIPGCAAVSTAVADILAERYDLIVQAVAVDDGAEMYQSLARVGDEASWLDITLCSALPADATHLRRYDDKLQPIGSAYTKIDAQRWYIMASWAHVLLLRDENACLLEFLDNGIPTLPLDKLHRQEQTVDQWLADNAALIEAATHCRSS